MAILFVDDELLGLRFMANAISQQLCQEVLTATEYTEGLRLIEDLTVDLSVVILDLVLEATSRSTMGSAPFIPQGFLLAKRVRKVRPESIVIGCSAWTGMEEMQWFHADSKATLIGKPVSCEDLIAEIDSMLR